MESLHQLEERLGYTFTNIEFEKEQEENLKSVKVGDTITFEGKCLDAGNWTECELIVE